MKTYVKNIIDDKELIEFNPENLKFYKDCKVGDFYMYGDKDINSLNPKKAEMGFYYFDNNMLTIKTYFDHPQGGGFVTQSFLVEINADKVLLNVVL